MRRLCFLLLLGAVNAACSDPDSAPRDTSRGTGGGSGYTSSGGTGGTASASGGAGGSTGGASGAGGTASPPIECNALELEPDVPVTQWTATSGAPPEALGGTVRNGIYFLTHVTMYGQSGIADFSGGRTKLVIDGASWGSVEDVDDAVDDETNPPRTFSYAFNPMGVTAAFNEGCPEPQAITVRYTAEEDSLTLFVTDRSATFGELFERQ